MAAIIEKNLTEVAAVAYLRGIDNEGNSVKVATNYVTYGLNWYGNECFVSVLSFFGLLTLYSSICSPLRSLAYSSL